MRRQEAQGDAAAASGAAADQFGQDYRLIGGSYVRVRGANMRCETMDVDRIARMLVERFGPAIADLEGAKKLTLAPAESSWFLVDAGTGWSVREPTLGVYSDREMLLMQRALEAGRADGSPKHSPAPESSEPKKR